MKPMQPHKRITEEGTVPYTRLYADADGESHVEDVEFAFNLMDLAPSAPPVHIASFIVRLSRSSFSERQPALIRGTIRPLCASLFSF
jgi:hypothetical protein